jgi:hypothetical protein
MKLFDWLKGKWSRSYNDISETISEDYVGERAPKGLRYSLIASLFLLVVLLLLGWHWSDEPDQFDVRQITGANIGQSGQPVIGAATTSTLIEAIDVVLHKRGGYLANDISPPGLWLDNLPSWEFGVLVQVRDLSKALRESFSRSQSQSTEDRDLALPSQGLMLIIEAGLCPGPRVNMLTAATISTVICSALGMSRFTMPSSTPVPTICAIGWVQLKPASAVYLSDSLPVSASGASIQISPVLPEPCSPLWHHKSWR